MSTTRNKTLWLVARVSALVRLKDHQNIPAKLGPDFLIKQLVHSCPGTFDSIGLKSYNLCYWAHMSEGERNLKPYDTYFIKLSILNQYDKEFGGGVIPIFGKLYFPEVLK